MARQARISVKLPFAIRQYLYRQQHLDEAILAAKIVFRLIEQAVTKPRPDQDSEKTIDEQGVELFLRYALMLVEPLHDEVSENKSDRPHQGIPFDFDRSYRERVYVGLPVNE